MINLFPLVFWRYLMAIISGVLAYVSYSTHYHLSLKVASLILIGIAYFCLGSYELWKTKSNKSHRVTQILRWLER